MSQETISLRQLSSVSFLKRDASVFAAGTPLATSISAASRCDSDSSRASRASRKPFLLSSLQRLSSYEPIAWNQSAWHRSTLQLNSPAEAPSAMDVLNKAMKRALGGGIPGMVAMIIQVFALMWMRTTINYQYRHGGTMLGTIGKLYKEGGIPRFYRGLLPALVQGPLSRFGDTAANAGMLALLQGFESTRDLPIWVQTLAASFSAGIFRIALMPVDALKTTLQVEGAAGLRVLSTKLASGGPTVLWHGALAASGATMVGHYPWFVTRNYMEELLPRFDDLLRKLLRAAVIGFVASAVSDTCSNSVRVIKTTKQTHVTPITYPQALRMVLAKDGITGLMFRGLGTKILSNGMQGLMFNVLWRMGMDYWDKMEASKTK